MICKVVARSDSSSGRQWLARSGVGRLKHFDIRLCWLQSAIHKKVLEVAPIGIKLNVSDLNTKKLSATRKRFLLYFLGGTRFDEESGQQEAVGETEFVEHMTEEALKVQIQRISRLTRCKANRSILQVAMALSVFGMKGCMDNDEQQPVENNENSWQQVALTMVVLAIIALCNFVFSHWDVLQTLLQTMLDRQGRKRKRDVERQDEGQGQNAEEQQESSDVEVEELEVEGQASATSEPRPPSTSPPRGPPPRAPKFSPIPIDPPPRWDPWSPEWFLYFMLGLQRRGQLMDHNTLLRYNHRRDILEMQLGILEQNHSEGVRRRAHMMCRGMTDLSPDSGSSAGPEVEEDPEPEHESIATHCYVGPAPEPEDESVGMQLRQQFSGTASSSHTGWTGRDEQFRSELDSGDGYFTSSSLPGRSLAMPSAGQDQQNDEGDDDAEVEDSETESHRRMRYIYAGIEEVSDPEYWQELHHFSSDDDDDASNSNRDDGN